MINKTFYIKVDEFGKQIPTMEFFPPQFNMLSHLGYYDFSKSKNVECILKKIIEAKNDKIQFSFAADDWCIVDVKGIQSKVSNGFDEFEPFNLETDFFIRLFQEWNSFLIKYETGEIPNLLK